MALVATGNPLPINAPDELIVHVAGAPIIIGEDGDWPNVHVPVSPVLKPPPVTAMLVPIGAVAGVRTMNGVLVVTVSCAEAESPVRPLTVIVYTPGVAPPLMMNAAPSSWPVAVIVHEEDDTTNGLAGACENVHIPASPVLNCPPVTVILVPTGAAFGDRVMNGARTVKVAVPASPVLPVTVTV